MRIPTWSWPRFRRAWCSSDPDDRAAGRKGRDGDAAGGFTSARRCRPTFGLKRAIDEVSSLGRGSGRRARISQTSGYGGFRSPHHDLPGGATDPRTSRNARDFADDRGRRPQVPQAVREQLMKGASQIKLMAGGGVASNYDPLDVTQYTEDETRAVVGAAAAWGTSRRYTPIRRERSSRQSAQATLHRARATGGRSHGEGSGAGGSVVEHAALPRRRGCNPVPRGVAESPQTAGDGGGTYTADALAKKHGVKLAWGTDTPSTQSSRPARSAAAQTAALVHARRRVLRMATHDNAQLLAMSGPRDPYPGRLGVVEEGASADLLLVDGDPLQDLSLVATPEGASSSS